MEGFITPHLSKTQFYCTKTFIFGKKSPGPKCETKLLTVYWYLGSEY